MATVAFVPVRGGSKSIPLKNIKPINGKPLIYWTLVSLENSAAVDRIVVATDSQEIADVALSFSFKKVQIYHRKSENAQDTSSTESVMLEYLSEAKLKATDFFFLVQATNPFSTAADFEAAIREFKKNKKARSLLSVVRTKRFFWNDKAQSVNYDPNKRPRRQDFNGLLMENGAFYLSRVGDILKSKNRLTKPILTYEMPEHSGFEIDEADDWIICSELLKKHRNDSSQTEFADIKLLLSDVDGVLTDAGMYYSEKGDELKKFSTYDGMAFKLLQKMGIKVGILTAEDRDLNRNRAKKLKLDFAFHGIENKAEKLAEVVKSLGIDYKNVAYVGDDINDIEVLKKVGFAFIPRNAQNEVRALSNVRRLNTAGGDGVIREIYNMIRS